MKKHVLMQITMNSVILSINLYLVIIIVSTYIGKEVQHPFGRRSSLLINSTSLSHGIVFPLP